jgi:transcription elongation factor GreA
MPTYISADGLQKLKDELEWRKTTVRREIAEKIGAAMELGDLSENFEYAEAKEEQGTNEVRISNLESMIKDSIIIEQQSGGDTIELGTTFTAEANGMRKTMQIVGSNEAKPLDGKISNESPIGQAFIGHKVGEEVSVAVPSGTMVYQILEIK